MTITDQIVENQSTIKAAVRSVVRNYHDAEDVTQTALLTAIRKQHQFQPGTNLRAWLKAVGRTAGINHYRQLRRRKSVSIEDVVSFAEPIAASPTNEPIPFTTLKQMLRSIRPNFRRVFWLRCVRQYSYEEIAYATGLPIGTVMSRLNRAREAVRILMGREDELHRPVNFVSVPEYARAGTAG